MLPPALDNGTLNSTTLNELEEQCPAIMKQFCESLISQTVQPTGTTRAALASSEGSRSSVRPQMVAKGSHPPPAIPAYT